MKDRIVLRNLCIAVGACLVAYALFGYFRGEIAIFSGKGRGTGTLYARDGEQVLLAALGYGSFAVAAFIFAVISMTAPSSTSAPSSDGVPGKRSLKIPGSVGFGILFVVIGFILVGFRSPS